MAARRAARPWRHMNEVLLVTGGSRGLGRNTSLSLARKGVDVILTYQSRADDAQAAVAEIERQLAGQTREGQTQGGQTREISLTR